jgi:hypothetical protein
MRASVAGLRQPGLIEDARLQIAAAEIASRIQVRGLRAEIGPFQFGTDGVTITTSSGERRLKIFLRFDVSLDG